MKIEKIEQPKHYQQGQKRCQRLVYHSGDGSTPRPSSDCCRFAKYIIAGKRFCYQHASEFVFLRSLENPNGGILVIDVDESKSIGRSKSRIERSLAGEIASSFQMRVAPWVLTCFGEKVANDPLQRNHRFLEESLELVQACGCTSKEAHELVDYVFGREVGEKAEEAGAVMLTLAALCLAQKLDMQLCAENELIRVWGIIDQIQYKFANKPKFGPLPE